MTRARRTAALFVCLAAGVTACDRKAPALPDDSSAPIGVGASTEADSIASIVTASGWDVGAGPFIVLPTVDGGLTSGSFLRPEATEVTVGDTIGIARVVADGRIELFSRAGRVGEARLSVDNAPRVDPGCTAWPVARLGALTGAAAGSATAGAASAGVASGAPTANWTAAFAAGRVQAIPLDSIEGMATRDSAGLAADLTRLASALPDDTSATFRGLPFVVLRAYRARGLESAFVVAILARRVNQEDSPKEERLVLVVDVAGANSKSWRVAWHERAAGREEELVVAEPLLAYFTNGSRDVHLLFGRDDGIALGAAVLVRTAGGWRVQWESAVAGCD